MQGEYVRLGKKISFVGSQFESVGQGLFTGGIPTPNQHTHAKCTTVAGYELADFSVTPDSQRFAFEHGAQAKINRHRT